MKYLVDILDKETDVYNEYLALAAKKKDALLENDLNAIEAIAVEEKGLTAKVLALEAARLEYLREQGHKTDISLEDLLGAIEGEDKDSIRKSADQLRDALVKCKNFNEDNMSLLRQSSNYINHMIRVFSRNINDDNPTYKQGAIKLGSGKIADMQG